MGSAMDVVEMVVVGNMDMDLEAEKALESDGMDEVVVMVVAAVQAVVLDKALTASVGTVLGVVALGKASDVMDTETASDVMDMDTA